MKKIGTILGADIYESPDVLEGLVYILNDEDLEIKESTPHEN